MELTEYNLEDDSVEEYLKNKIDSGLIDKTLQPIKCICGSKDLYDVVVSKIDYMEVEKEIVCKNCNKKVGYWSYGNWEV